ncbi:hypothetical protein CP532_6622 [Ophiocordyceps camponoti-leonardi (nom. inval.)]|nr:hypothetical protein CP532_6622 [Ophiocordyceps camponoti-leonardi (nom. inval.)]
MISLKGCCRSVSTSGRYECKKRLRKHHLIRALSSIVSSQPMLRVGIDIDRDRPERSKHFLHLESIDLSSHVFFHKLEDRAAGEDEDEDSKEGEEKGLMKRLQDIHDMMWTHLNKRPPWKLFVFSYDDDDDDQQKQDINNNKKVVIVYDIVFVFHHALMDGISGRNFHQLLRRALNDYCYGNNNHDDSNETILFFPNDKPTIIPAPQDQAIPFNLGLGIKLKIRAAVLAYRLLYKPAAKKPDPDPDLKKASNSRLLAINLPASSVASLVAGCRARKTTVTAILHALIMTSLARRLSDSSSSLKSSSFRATTTIDLRRYLDEDDDNIKDGNRGQLRLLATIYPHQVAPSDVLLAIGQQQDDEWRNSPCYPPLLSDPKCVLHVAFNEKEPCHSFLSNVGLLLLDDDDDKKQDDDIAAFCHISRLRFAHLPFSDGGPPIFVSVASVAGGDMTIIIGWTHGLVVSDELVNGLAHDLGAWTKAFAQSGRFFSPAAASPSTSSSSPA